MRYSKLFLSIYFLVITTAYGIEVDVKIKEAQKTITDSIIFEKDNAKESKEKLADLWEKLEMSADGGYELIEESIVNLLKYSDRVFPTISDESYDNFMQGAYWLLRLSGIYRKSRTIWYYYDCIRDPFIDREKA